ncbi:phosphohydrolase [Clostridium thermosuccinogenes]|uniref:Phosphohydrolase n=1 Tax=Clostridium thermosuccinogenes TaxID=84032 RepID=A0A2K2FM36_9CLOT|nr:HD domain-containing protein [Pseudoclostridium thermosuccinogenes]AUS95909.1 phosphohydrolase [Pseudoclostridium thermosuccinogenes]PNT97904.1 phosphohydrolase [Pseudoclostridium thermosuccinogenes]PNT99836.1 phosphohydrolase [Pseudoclostridium thermosuccinogenes]
MFNERLEKQVEFITEIDKLKHINRQTILMDGSRHENDAEHSWHLAVMAMLLSEHAVDKNIDLLKVIKMVLVHDLVEIDAGDTYCYDEKACEDKAEREQKAANRLFNILPEDQAREIRKLWEEFEERKTPEACFASALDRFQPLLHNYKTQGKSWREHGVTKDKVIKRNKAIEDGSVTMWEYAERFINESVEKGYLGK